MKNQLLKYIYENLLNKEVEIDEDTPLYTSSLITSMGHLKMINFIERTFEISVPMSKISMENFDTVNQIAEFIQNVKENQ